VPPVVPWTQCGACRLSFFGPSACCRVGGTRDIPVEALFPQGRERFELVSSGWSQASPTAKLFARGVRNE
jgi:hypothetical protein